MDKVWTELDADYMRFKEVLDEVKRRLVAVLDKGPKTAFDVEEELFKDHEAGVVSRSAKALPLLRRCFPNGIPLSVYPVALLLGPLARTASLNRRSSGRGGWRKPRRKPTRDHP